MVRAAMRLSDDTAIRTALKRLLPSVPEALFVSLLSAASLRTFRRGERVLAAGHPALHVALVESGHVALQLEVQHEPRLTGLRGPGSLLGAGAWLAGRAHDYTVVALQKSRVLLMSGLALSDLLAVAPTGALDLARNVADENAQLLRRVRCLHLPLRARLAHALLELAGEGREDLANGAPLTLPMSKSDLASLLGVAPESLSRAIRALSDEGLVRIEGRRGVLLDVEGLRQAHAGRVPSADVDEGGPT